MWWTQHLLKLRKKEKKRKKEKEHKQAKGFLLTRSYGDHCPFAPVVKSVVTVQYINHPTYKNWEPLRHCNPYRL